VDTCAWSCTRVAFLYQNVYKYVYSVQIYQHFMKLRIETESHLVFVRKSWDYSRRPIYGGFPRTKFVMVGLVVFKLQLFELFCCLLLKVFSCSQNISFWRYNSQNLGEHRSDPHLPKAQPWAEWPFSAVSGLDRTCHVLALYRSIPTFPVGENLGKFGGPQLPQQTLHVNPTSKSIFLDLPLAYNVE